LSQVRSIVSGLALSLAVLVVGVVLLDLASRVLLPVSPGSRFLDEAGNPIDFYLKLTLTPNAHFRQITADYDSWARIGPNGYREPDGGPNPAIVFLGDSFTFGLGLTDEQTFAAKYCAAIAAACANLGRPGSGTILQVSILDHFLRTYGWHPREVKLFIFAYAGALASGNDLLDAALERFVDDGATGTPEVARGPVHTNSAAARVAELWRWVLAHSNLARVVYQQFGPLLRSWQAVGSQPAQLEAGIRAVGRGLDRLQQLSEAYGFACTVYVLHPVQDLLNDTVAVTVDAVQRAARAQPVVSTAPALADLPPMYYFPYDGHFNAVGASRIADFLLARDGAPER
jgi:hypothetical protein